MLSVTATASAFLPALANRANAAVWRKEGNKWDDLLSVHFGKLDMPALGQVAIQKQHLPFAMRLLHDSGNIPVLIVCFNERKLLFHCLKT